jgi:hypothetical protein
MEDICFQFQKEKKSEFEEEEKEILIPHGIIELAIPELMISIFFSKWSTCPWIIK